MKLKYLFYILAFVLVLLWGVVLTLVTEEYGWKFYVIEGIVTFSLFYLVYFYRKVVKPLNSIAGGMDLLRAQDFSSRLSSVGQREADRIVSIFNRMMDQLKEERLRLREQNHFLDLLISASPMGVIILTFDEKISMANQAALKFLGEVSEEEVMDKSMDELTGALSDELARIPKETVVTVRLSDSQIYRCSRLSFIDRGFAHPFYLIESLTSEVMKAEKKAYEQVIRMIVGSQHVESQVELIMELDKAGFPCGQATLSRDLKQLRISKVRTRGGHAVYALPKDGQFVATPTREEVNQGRWGVQFSGQMMVIHTPPSYASMVASEVDALKNPMLLGSVAGDDTIIVVLAEDADREEVALIISKIIRKIR